MDVQQIIKKQAWEEHREKESGALFYEFEDDPDTLKIFFADANINIDVLKRQLWNTYYSRILIYKQNHSQYKIWTNDQSPENDGKNFEDKSFDEKISPIEYWDNYITKTPRNTVDKKLEESILTVFQNLERKYPKKDDLISIILACTFIRFLEDRNLTDIPNKLINALSTKQDAIELFSTYNDLHNGMLFKQDTLYSLDDETCQTLKNFLKADLFKQKSLFCFDFKYIPIELISSIYEKLLTEKLGREEKKKCGIAYTPPKLASYLTKQAFRQLDQKFDKKDFGKIKIGDLSTGSGIFLVLSFRELLKRMSKQVSFEEKKKILEESLCGIDLDESAINITIFSLYVELLGKEKEKLSAQNKFPILKNRIKTQDALLYLEHDNFFDLIIGNPPWKGRDSDSFNKIKDRKFKDDVCNKEIAQMFVQIGLEKLKSDGILALVLPSAGFYNPSSFKFRNSVLRKTIIKEFVDFSPIRNIVFKNNKVEPSILMAQKNNEHSIPYTIPMRRATNKADYLYFNHISGNTNNIDSNFLQSRDDSWQIAIRGGNMATLFIDRLNKNYVNLGSIVKKITTGYQGSLKDGGNKTISESQGGIFSTPIIYDLGKEYYCAKSKKSSSSHKLLDPCFINSECLIIYKKYKFDRTNRLSVFLKPKDVSFSEYFVGIRVEDKNLLYFLAALLTSRLAMFFVNMTGTTAPLISCEQKKPRLNKLDIKKIPFSREYSQFKNVIQIGKKLLNFNFKNLPELQNSIDSEIEKMFQVDVVEKYIIQQWEKMTKRKNMDIHDVNIKSYQTGFEYMLDSYNLPKPKQWSEKIFNGVEIISFSETTKQPEINDKIKEEIKNIVTAKKDIYFDFINDSQGIIIRREKNNYGFLTGLLDAERILSSL